MTLSDDPVLTSDDLDAASCAAVALLRQVPDASWSVTVPDLEMTVVAVAVHQVQCCLWYAVDLAAEGTTGGDTEGIEAKVNGDAPPAQLIDGLTTGARLLGAAVDAAGDEVRGFHPFGQADRTGFAAMACDEMLVHSRDIAVTLGLAFTPDPDVVDRVLRRLFPWAPTDGDPWTNLLWANGRIPRADRPRLDRWRWHCAPLSEWDGQPPARQR